MTTDSGYAMAQLPHNVVLEGRKKLSLTGVTDIENFNENEVILAASKWTILVHGEDLHMEKLSVDTGDVIITGRIDGVEYEDGGAPEGGFFSRLFK